MRFHFSRAAAVAAAAGAAMKLLKIQKRKTTKKKRFMWDDGKHNGMVNPQTDVFFLFFFSIKVFTSAITCCELIYIKKVIESDSGLAEKFAHVCHVGRG